MNKSPRKIAILAGIYVALLLPAMVVAGEGRRLSVAYYSGCTVRVHSLMTADGYSFDYTTVLRDDLAGAPANSVPCVVALHGLGNSKEEALARAIHFARNGYAVLVPDLRGMGSHEAGIDLSLEWQDVAAMMDAVDAMDDLYGMINFSNVGAWGHSNGAFQSMMISIHDPRVKATIASSGAYNTSELLRFMDSRIFVVGFTWDPNDPDEIRKRSPIDLATPDNPANLLLFHGTEDDNVPFIHSVQLNATVNPDGNRTDYEFVVEEGKGHSLPGPDYMRKCIAWFDTYLKGAPPANESTIPLFVEPFPASEIERQYEIALLLVIAGFFPLALLVEQAFVAVWNAAATRRGKEKGSRRLLAGDYRREVLQALHRPSPPSLTGISTGEKVRVLGLVTGAWLAGCLVAGLLVLAGQPWFSRVLGASAFPGLIMLAVLLVHDAIAGLKKGANGTRRARAFDYLGATASIQDTAYKDLLVAAVAVIPAWVVQHQIFNLLGRGGAVHVTVVNVLLESHPVNPMNGGTFLTLGIFIVAVLSLSSSFRGVFCIITGGAMDNTAGLLSRRGKKAAGKNVGDRGGTNETAVGSRIDGKAFTVGFQARRFLAWLGLALAYSAFTGVVTILGCELYQAFMVNPPLTGVDLDMNLNDALSLAMGLVMLVATFIQQILEKLTRSHFKSVLVTALVLLGVFVNITPRPF